jgi:23S rRNA (adenine2030-N6)-methyltransferase
MNYRHIFHAGNFADVLKHAALVSVLLHLKKKEKPFTVIDTHAGRGVYNVGGDDARKTGEAAEGVARLLALSSVPGVLGTYLEIVRSFGGNRYPGSPLIASHMLRAHDRLVAVEYQATEFNALKAELSAVRNARAIRSDGYEELRQLLPPPERRGVVLIDPPYEQPDEFARAAKVLIAAHQRFASGIYLLWYPAKTLPLVAATAAELLNAAIRSLVRIELDIGAASAPEREGRGPAMRATGLLAVNPPFGFTGAMDDVLPFMTETLAQGPGASSRIEILAQR